MKLIVVFVLLIVVPALAFGKHISSDYLKGDPVDYASMNTYIEAKGWDTVFYAYGVGTAMHFTRGTINISGQTKNVLFYYWKGFQVKVDSNGDALTDDVSLASPVRAAGPDPSKFIEDPLKTGLIFDLNLINAGRKSKEDRLIGYRGLIYDSDTATKGNLFEVVPDPGGKASVRMFPRLYMIFHWMLDKTTREPRGLFVESNATAPHTIDQFFKLKNYSEEIHGAALTAP